MTVLTRIQGAEFRQFGAPGWPSYLCEISALSPCSPLQIALTRVRDEYRLTISNLHLIWGGPPLHPVVVGKHGEGIRLPEEPTVERAGGVEDKKAS